MCIRDSIIYNSRILSKLYKAKTNKKESGVINETKQNVSPSFKKQHSYHEASTFDTEALMSKNNKSLSSRKSETQVVQDWLNCRKKGRANFYGLFTWRRGPQVGMVTHLGGVTRLSI